MRQQVQVPPRRPVRRPRRGRRLWLVLVAALGVVVVLTAVQRTGADRRSFAPPERRSYAPPGRQALAGLSLRARIVAVATSQVGYATDPPSSYCNKYSASWGVGGSGCPAGETSEEWCADFAAWAWQRAGVQFSYGYGRDQIDAAAASFYVWGVHEGTWHPARSGYRPQPGDVALYGLDPARLSAVHVAVVTGFRPGAAGPDVVNGDGDQAGFSVVEDGTGQDRADARDPGSGLSGYVSPAGA